MVLKVNLSLPAKFHCQQNLYSSANIYKGVLMKEMLTRKKEGETLCKIDIH